MRKDIKKCIALSGYQVRFADKDELIEKMKENMSPSKLSKNNGSDFEDEIDSQKMEIDDEKEDNVFQELKKIIYQMLSILSNTGSLLHIIG